MQVIPKVKKLSLSDINDAAYNPRGISKEALAGLMGSIEEYGFMELPVVNTFKDRNRLVSGHQRLKALRKDGFTHVDCILVSFDDADEMSANLTMNNRHVRGKWHFEKAKKILDDARARAVPNTTQFDQLRERLRLQASRAPQKREAQKYRETKDAVSEVGHVYKLGRHIVICGDFLDATVSQALKRGKTITGCVTDPPYNVAYAPSDVGIEVKNDSKNSSDWLAFLNSVCTRLNKVVKGETFMFMSSKEFPMLQMCWENSKGRIIRWLTWIKDRPTVFPGRPTDYCNQYEWIVSRGPCAWRDKIQEVFNHFQVQAVYIRS